MNKMREYERGREDGLDLARRIVKEPVPGFYAEDVYKQYPEGVIFNEDGQIEDWNYRTMIPAMMKVIQDQNERINTLEDTVNALNERLNKLEGMLKGVVK